MRSVIGRDYLKMKNTQPASVGELVIVGTGINFGQLTLEAKAEIEHADLVLSAVPNGVMADYLTQLNGNIDSLMAYYGEGRTRVETYTAMTKRIVEETLAGKRVCAVFYGHPGVFVTASHAAIQYLKARGIRARLLPGVSAADCLFADLNIDPSHHSLVMHDATAFILADRPIDPNMGMVFWQIGIMGDFSLQKYEPSQQALCLLRDLLRQHFPSNHQICLYEAATLPGFSPRTDWFSLSALAEQRTKSYSTLYVPAIEMPYLADDRLARLGITEADLDKFELDPTSTIVA